MTYCAGVKVLPLSIPATTQQATPMSFFWRFCGACWGADVDEVGSFSNNAVSGLSSSNEVSRSGFPPPTFSISFGVTSTASKIAPNTNPMPRSFSHGTVKGSAVNPNRPKRALNQPVIASVMPQITMPNPDPIVATTGLRRRFDVVQVPPPIAANQLKEGHEPLRMHWKKYTMTPTK
jgi:hypothetical protein